MKPNQRVAQRVSRCFVSLDETPDGIRPVRDQLPKVAETFDAQRRTESREEPTQGDDEPGPMDVDDKGGEAKAKKKRKGIFPSPIDGPEDDQIHITATLDRTMDRHRAILVDTDSF